MRARVACAVAAVVLVSPASASAVGPGSLDPSFGTGGVVATSVGPSGHAQDVAVAPDGRLIVGGTTAEASGGQAFRLLRYTVGGQVDETWGTRGTVVLQPGEGPHPSSRLSSLVAEPDGGVVAVGTATGSDGRDEVVAARLDATGRVMWQVRYQLGKWTQPRPGPDGKPYVFSHGGRAIRQPDGKLLIAGQATTDVRKTGEGSDGLFDLDVLLARLDGEDGSLDRSFGDRGSVVERRNTQGDAGATDLLLTPSGSIVVGGSAVTNCGWKTCAQPVLEAFSPDGVRDDSFATGPLGMRAIHRLAPGPNGTILAAGSGAEPRESGGNDTFARYTAAGALDPTFAAPARVVTRPVSTDGSVVDLDVQPDGRILAALNADGPGRVIRLLPDGSPDESFGSAGAASAGTAVDPVGMALQTDGRIVVAGTPVAWNSERAFFSAARLLGGTSAGRVVIAPSAPVRGRSAAVSLTCRFRGATPCAGALKVTSVRGRGRGRAGGRRVGFGRATFSLAAGTRAAVRVRLNRGGLRRIRRAGRRLVVRVRVTDRAGRVVQRRVKLRARVVR